MWWFNLREKNAIIFVSSECCLEVIGRNAISFSNYTLA